MQLMDRFRFFVDLLLNLISLLTDSGYFVVKPSLLFKVAMLVIVCLALEVNTFFVLHRLPRAAYFLHNFECTHVDVGLYNLWSCL